MCPERSVCSVAALSTLQLTFSLAAGKSSGSREPTGGCIAGQSVFSLFLEKDDWQAGPFCMQATAPSPRFLLSFVSDWVSLPLKPLVSTHCTPTHTLLIGFSFERLSFCQNSASNSQSSSKICFLEKRIFLYLLYETPALEFCYGKKKCAGLQYRALVPGPGPIRQGPAMLESCVHALTTNQTQSEFAFFSV